MYNFIKNATKIYQQIRDNDPSFKSFCCYSFDLLDMRLLYEAMKDNTHVTSCDIRIEECAKDYNAMAKCKLAILDIVRNNLLCQLDEARDFAEKLQTKARESNGHNNI
jgi:hypothetical protein